MNAEKLISILELHKKWLENLEEGIRADLSGANLSDADLSSVNLRHADLSSANLSSANLRHADLSDANLSDANLSDANLSDANLSSVNLSSVNLRHADLSSANLRHADLSDADLSSANLSDANLSSVNLSGAQGLLDAINYMGAHFERTTAGYIVYKSFDAYKHHPEHWQIKPGEVITETANPNRTDLCGCGINVAPLEWVRNDNSRKPYKLLIRFEWLPGVIVPYNTDGKIRCSRAEIIDVVDKV